VLLLALVAVPAHHEPLAGAVAGLLVAAVVGNNAVQVASTNWKSDLVSHYSIGGNYQS